MKWYLMLLVLVTSFLVFTALLQVILLSDKRMKKRMKRYLNQKEHKPFSKKQFQSMLQMQLHTDKLKRKLITKEKGNKLEIALYRAGVPFKPEEFVLFKWILTIIAGCIFYIISGKLIFLALGVVLGWSYPGWMLKRKQQKRVQRFNDGLPDMITTVVGAMRAGFSFPQSLQTVVEESSSPIKEEIETVLREMQYGSSMEESLNGLQERMPSDDLDLMVQAILIQRQVGGNLATVLEKIVDTIRDRTKIQRQIKTLTAQGRLSGIVIGLLPIILAFVIYLIEPEYIGSLFTSSIGLIMVGAGLTSGVLGFFMIQKITTIEV
ncbi:type II secretion system F family protein [Thalassobacillus hwangdonensis]|uniref:Type II secretion system F family protein n=1 Tax=Thalassobacillus hwangdonensis TaxID=546108 RepID=A0ABW3L3X6_9BACI